MSLESKIDRLLQAVDNINAKFDRIDQKIMQLEEKTNERQDFLTVDIDNKASSDELNQLKVKRTVYFTENYGYRRLKKS